MSLKKIHRIRLSIGTKCILTYRHKQIQHPKCCSTSKKPPKLMQCQQNQPSWKLDIFLRYSPWTGFKNQTKQILNRNLCRNFHGITISSLFIAFWFLFLHEILLLHLNHVCSNLDLCYCNITKHFSFHRFICF